MTEQMKELDRLEQLGKALSLKYMQHHFLFTQALLKVGTSFRDDPEPEELVTLLKATAELTGNVIQTLGELQKLWTQLADLVVKEC